MTTHAETVRGRGFRSVLATVGAALNVARSVEAGRKPEGRLLRVLGIDEKAFGEIHLR